MNILIIDDEPIVRQGLKYILKNSIVMDYTFQVTEADGSSMAEQILESQAFDFIFTDIKMPGMDGLTFIDKWKDKFHETQWVILSGYDNFEYAQRAISLGVKEYLLKPITKKNAQETLQRLVEHYLKARNNFISLNELGLILKELEEVVWTLNKQELIAVLQRWSQKNVSKDTDVSYYLNIINNLFSTLINQINDRGSIQLEIEESGINGRSIEEINSNFHRSCLELIELTEKQRKGQVLDPIEYAKKYIQENLDAKLTLEDVASKIGLNAAYFSHLFKKETGISFIDYRLQLRMEKAKKLIESDYMKITEIANSLGYEDLSHFTKSFKKYTGYSPTKYSFMLGIQK